DAGGRAGAGGGTAPGGWAGGRSAPAAAERAARCFGSRGRGAARADPGQSVAAGRRGRFVRAADPNAAPSPPGVRIRAVSDQGQKAARFLELHQPRRPLLLANAWDAGSAKVLAALGFEAIASTSSG